MTSSTGSRADPWHPSPVLELQAPALLRRAARLEEARLEEVGWLGSRKPAARLEEARLEFEEAGTTTRASDSLPHDLSTPDRFHCMSLPPLATPLRGADALSQATEVFQAAIERPLALRTDDGRPRYPWTFAPGGAERLARAFAEARIAQPEAPLTPELQATRERQKAEETR